MKINARACLALFLAEIILFASAGSCFAAGFTRTPSNLTELGNELQKPYLTLFRISPSLHFTSNQVKQMQDLLQKQQGECVGGDETEC